MNQETVITSPIMQQNDLTQVLLKKFIAGDNEAFSKLYDLHINILFNYGLRLTSDGELLKDCIQDIFVKMYNQKEIFRSIDNLRSYLFISLKNKLYDENRKRNFVSALSVEKLNPADSINIEDGYINREKDSINRKLVNKLMNELTPRQRQAITLYYIEEKKYEDICVIMEMNYQSVRNLMHRGLHKIRSTVELPE